MRKMDNHQNLINVEKLDIEASYNVPTMDSSHQLSSSNIDEDIERGSPLKAFSRIKTIKSNGNLLRYRPELDALHLGLQNLSARDKISQIDDEEYYGETYENPDDLHDRFTIHNHDQSTLSTHEKKS